MVRIKSHTEPTAFYNTEKRMKKYLSYVLGPKTFSKSTNRILIEKSIKVWFMRVMYCNYYRIRQMQMKEHVLENFVKALYYYIF